MAHKVVYIVHFIARLCQQFFHHYWCHIDNNVEKQISVAYSDGYSSEIVKKAAPYDVIFANILARPLIAMAEDMAKSLKKGGYAVISGFIDDQVEWVLGEHEKFGLKLKKLYELDNWRAALLEKE